jgi:hypothetical protein
MPDFIEIALFYFARPSGREHSVDAGAGGAVLGLPSCDLSGEQLAIADASADALAAEDADLDLN